jgi:hypothetical protein
MRRVWSVRVGSGHLLFLLHHPHCSPYTQDPALVPSLFPITWRDHEEGSIYSTSTGFITSVTFEGLGSHWATESRRLWANVPSLSQFWSLLVLSPSWICFLWCLSSCATIIVQHHYTFCGLYKLGYILLKQVLNKIPTYEMMLTQQIGPNKFYSMDRRQKQITSEYCKLQENIDARKIIFSLLLHLLNCILLMDLAL